MKAIKAVTALGCEYVATGSRGKHTLINVYAGDIFVREFPAVFPMAFYFELAPEQSPEVVDIKFEVLIDGDKRAEVGVEFPADRTELGLVALPQLPLSMEKEGVIRVVASGSRYRKTVLIEKKVSAGPIPD